MAWEPYTFGRPKDDRGCVRVAWKTACSEHEALKRAARQAMMVTWMNKILKLTAPDSNSDGLQPSSDGLQQRTTIIRRQFTVLGRPQAGWRLLGQNVLKKGKKVTSEVEIGNSCLC